MKRVAASLVVLVVSALVAIACTSAPTASPAGTTAPVATLLEGVALPTLAVWPLPANWACGGVGLEGTVTLEGSPGEGVYGLWTRTPPAAGTPYPPQRVPITWPPGYRAVFGPTMTIQDSQGEVVASAGTDLQEQSRLGDLLICIEGDRIEMLR